MTLSDLKDANETIEAGKSLEDAGFTRDQANAIAHVAKSAQGDLATKDHVNAVKVELKADIKSLRKAIGLTLSIIVGMLIIILTTILY